MGIAIPIYRMAKTSAKTESGEYNNDKSESQPENTKVGNTKCRKTAENVFLTNWIEN